MYNFPVNTARLRTLLVLGLLAQAVSGYSQEGNRPVEWVHGLGGDETTWDLYEGIFEAERRMVAESNDYNSGVGLAAFGNEVLDDAETDFGVATTNVMGIGHSLGGVALRVADRNEPAQKFNALVSVGSPHLGAGIANSVINGNVARATAFACQELLAGPTSVPFILSTMIFSGVTPRDLCNALQDEVVVPILGQLAASPSVVDVSVNSGFLNALNAAPSTAPIISIRGVEDGPSHWRLLTSVQNVTDPDDRWVNIARSMRAFYHGRVIVNVGRSIIFSIAGFVNPVFFIGVGPSAGLAAQWGRGVRWFDNSETIWNGLIDCIAATATTVTVTPGVFRPCDRFSTGSPEWVKCLAEFCGSPSCPTTITRTVTARVRENSDGFICGDSQVSPNSFDVIVAEGINHSQETNATAESGGDPDQDEIIISFDDVFDRLGTDFRIPR